MDLKISELMQMQHALHKLHEADWSPLEPEYGKNTVLYMIEEIGEVSAILKKKGDRAVVESPDVRAAFLEEMADALMYYTDTLLRYHVTADELSDAYARKFQKNMGRNYTQEYKELYNNGQD